MHAKRATLANQAIEQHRRALRNAIVVEKELLEFVDDQHDSRQTHAWANPAETSDVLHARFAKQLAATGEFCVKTLEHAESELTIGLDGHSARVRQSALRVGLELDALLEVDQPELDLVG